MYDDQDFQGSGQFDQSSGTYHYTYYPEHNAAPAPEQPPKKKKGGFGAKAVALVLCCALVGGGAGVGGAALYSAVTGSGSRTSGTTTIYQSTTEPTKVNVVQADGVSPMSLSEIYASYADACVCITVTATVQQGWYQYQSTGAGSGFIITEDGYVVTNYHVIDGATSIQVTLNNGETYDASLVGGEELNDVAVVKIEGVTGLKTVVLGDSDDLVVGETVSTIGNALGTLSFSQTSGAVSAVGRSVTMSDGTILNMIQTDATINSGNSGGPLFDSYGRVVGITSAKYSNNGDSSEATIEGIGFAIPINDVIDIVTDYMQYGYVTGRPYLGVTVAEITSQYIQAFGWPEGVYVNSVESGSCAEAAGMKQGDIITKVGDTDVTSVSELTAAKNQFKAGETTTLTVYRSGETITLTVTFDEQSSSSTSGTTSDSSNSTDNSSSGNSGNSGNSGSGSNGYGYGYGYGRP
jgi:serine protease Do